MPTPGIPPRSGTDGKLHRCLVAMREFGTMDTVKKILHGDRIAVHYGKVQPRKKPDMARKANHPIEISFFGQIQSGRNQLGPNTQSLMRRRNRQGTNLPGFFLYGM